MTALQKAIEEQNLEEVKHLLTTTPESIGEETEETGIPMALYAAAVSSFEVVKYLVEYSRANLDLWDSRHRTILHYATESGDAERVKYLTERCGMDPLMGDRDLLTPFEMAHRFRVGDMHLEKALMELRYTDTKGVEAFERAQQTGEVYQYFTEYLGGEFEDFYSNPIRTGFFPDPSICRVGEDYYMVNSSFVFYPCIPVSHSRNLVDWEIIGYAICNPEWSHLGELEGGRGYWAPDISYDNGTFYITATYRMNDVGPVYRRQIVVSSDRPEGPYSEPAYIEEDGIDPSLFHEDGKHYMLLNRGARILELSEDCKRQVGEAKLLYYGDNKHAPEGPHILKKDGYYYLFQAEGGTGMGHRVSVSRSRELMGIYEPCPYNPIMRQDDDQAVIQCCGHGKPVQTQDGDWYMVYLCSRKLRYKYSFLGRETALDPITWTADGWPIVNHRKGPSALQKRPKLSVGEKQVLIVDDHELHVEQTRPEIHMNWLFPREPQEGAFTLLEGGRFRLLSSPHPLEKVEARNILLRRQQHFNFSAIAILEQTGLEEGQEYGMVCYYDENTWVSACLGVEKGKYYCQIKERIGKETIFHDRTELAADPGRKQIFTVDTVGIRRRFTIESLDPEGDGMPRELLKEDLGNVYYLCDEGIKMGKRFTGAMVGVYGCGGEKQFTYELESFATYKG